MAGRNQAAFARAHGIPGGASMVSQHISGHRPVSLEAAIAYARGFGVPIGQISPDAAELIANSAQLLANNANSNTTHTASEAPGLYQLNSANSQAQPLILDSYTVPLKIEWEDLMALTDLPEVFRAAVPDDALAPRLVWVWRWLKKLARCHAAGVGVLVKDAAGALHIRRYAQGAAGRWVAQALNDAYATLPGTEVQLLAVMTGRMTGEI